ncbi:Detected protein of unknown function [Hibiscus syriacus]|uniref:PROP1-like PPR domain-containing protein n=2 Tax=Hibiscus syriacus TaxID=106335 RepID=A0A6A2YLS2_HIBSY|nr:Detected protein of unknown function [Hibiscus syriacus]
MIGSGILPDRLSSHGLILGLCKSGMLDVGMKILKTMISVGVEVDRFTFNLLISKCSERGDTRRTFDLVNVMNLLGIFPDVETLNAIIIGLNRNLALQESHIILHEMAQKGFLPKGKQYIKLINAMCRLRNLQTAFQVKDEMTSLGIASPDVAESAVVRGLALCGKVEESTLVLDRMLREQLVPTVATFTTLMYRFCKESNVAEALKLRSKMELCGLKLDVIAYNVIISGLCAEGDIAAAFELYREMKQNGLWPNATTFTVLVDALLTEGSDPSTGDVLLKDLKGRGIISCDWDGSTEQFQKALIIAKKRLKYMNRNKRK